MVECKIGCSWISEALKQETGTSSTHVTGACVKNLRWIFPRDTQMASLIKSKYVARLTSTPSDITAAQRLRYKAFGLSGGTGLDSDKFDQACEHFLIENRKTGHLVCCFRLMHMQGGGEIEESYSAQYYELSALHRYDGKIVEMGRFCVDPRVMDVDVLRLAWAAMTRFVEAERVDLLFETLFDHPIC